MDQIKAFILDHYIIQTLVIVFAIILSKGKFNFGKVFGWISKIKVGKVEAEIRKPEEKTVEKCPVSLQEKHEKQFTDFAGFLQEERKERVKRQEYVDKVFSEIKGQIETVASQLKTVTVQSAMGNIFAPDTPPLEVFNAAIVYFKNHGNGNAQQQVLSVIGQNKAHIETWRTALSDDMKKNGLCEDRYFQEAIKWINDQIR